jgi:uncharacterized RmlC-like cupin family protein
MGNGQMPRVSMVDGWRSRPRGTEPARPDLRTQGESAIIRSHGEKCRRSTGEPCVSGPSPGAHELRLHLVLIPPGTRCLPHFHAATESAIYVVSGEADVWHGCDLANRAAVRAGDFIYLPPGTPHLTVNHGEVTSIAVVARADAADHAEPVVIELPRHLDGLLTYPVAVGE